MVLLFSCLCSVVCFAALRYRRVATRLAHVAPVRATFDWRSEEGAEAGALAKAFHLAPARGKTVADQDSGLRMTLAGEHGGKFSINNLKLGPAFRLPFPIGDCSDRALLLRPCSCSCSCGCC